VIIQSINKYTSNANAFPHSATDFLHFRIDDDILNLIDEFDFDLFLKDISNVIGQSEKWIAYITERSAVMVERFLVSLFVCSFSASIDHSSSEIIPLSLYRPRAGLLAQNVYPNRETRAPRWLGPHL
jgi:hypothetical protein